MKIAMGSDEAGFELKKILADFVKSSGHEVIDLGVHDDKPVMYADIAVDVARSVLGGDAQRGILICGTGIGMAIAANKVPGIRA
ncbi:MAG: RpiB/LacA/LacB family sugar-phosphate isomerase, partial [Rectinemataceae bacterium]|nr:RpiB/LacA/LacB family sugar-phosphate isomerase [Rectinemataceae bacterium]